jgi:hypothetical protein
MAEGPYGPETTILATFTAPPDRAVFLTNCNGAVPIGLQRRVGERWVNAWVAEINGCMSAPIAVPPGTQHTTKMTVVSRSFEPRSAGQRIEPGTYRVVWFGALSSFDPGARPHGEELPLEERVSAPIRIDVAE